jgi:hypothetical protein
VAGYREEWHKHALDVIDWGFGEVVSLDELREIWTLS